MRRRVGSARVVECGIALARADAAALGETVVSCGLAGGLRADLPTGTVVIPRIVATPAGDRRHCDEELVQRLCEAATRLGYAWTSEPLLTSATLVTGDERSRWAQAGFCAVDMETGLLPGRRLAALRVILDTPLREISADWLHPARAFLRPSNWAQLPMLVREAPRCADIAARVAAEAFA